MATAHQAWDRAWRSLEASGEASPWRTPERGVLEAIELLKARKARAVLDIGTGLGRHAIALAESGFDVVALDASPGGIQAAARSAQASGVHVELVLGSFLDLPFLDRRFDYILAWNVIYHGDRSAVVQAIGEIARALVPGGLYQGTMLSRRHRDLGIAREISPGTLVQAAGERAHPHFYCDARELLELHQGFEPLQLGDRDQGVATDGQWHWEFIFEASSSTG